jgi:hypothetical protein
MRVPTLLMLVASVAGVAQTVSRPPAVPLIAHDPYFSIWSMADTLTAEVTKHWTGKEQALSALARIDGKTYRFMGTAGGRDVPPMRQTALLVTPTRTRYSFEQGGVALDLTFLTPAIADDLEILSRPLTYLVFAARAVDGRAHQVSLYFDASAVLAANAGDQRTAWSRVKIGDLAVLRAGTAEQAVLGRSGDDLRIDWGYLYLAVPPQGGGAAAAIAATTARGRQEFIESGAFPANDEVESIPVSARNQMLLAARFDLGQVSGAEAVSRRLMIAYDDLFSIQYLYRNLRPYWRRNGMGIAELLERGQAEYAALAARSERFDSALRGQLEAAGGPKYADIAVLAYRQTLAAHKLVADLDGTPMYFSKENFSNGCIDTVDVTYPSAPFFLALSPQLLKAQLKPMFDYANLPRWRWPFAPHDLGTYPLANGQVYGGGERTAENQMPVEESGNLILLAAGLARAEGSTGFTAKYWPLLTRWAEYLAEKGLDPENQLTTDDFAGHIAHNTNLSLKAIAALGAYAQLARKLGHEDVAARYQDMARQMASKWTQMAAENDHYRLTFDRQGTWSQKYNLVWDRLLGLNLFPPEVVAREMAWYGKVQNRYGLPLDNRETYTKLDWILWTATLARNRADFEALVDPVHLFLNETPTRVPMTDWYGTVDGKQRGFQARSVVGGVFIKLLAERWGAQ